MKKQGTTLLFLLFTILSTVMAQNEYEFEEGPQEDTIIERQNFNGANLSARYDAGGYPLLVPVITYNRGMRVYYIGPKIISMGGVILGGVAGYSHFFNREKRVVDLYFNVEFQAQPYVYGIDIGCIPAGKREMELDFLLGVGMNVNITKTFYISSGASAGVRRTWSSCTYNYVSAMIKLGVGVSLN